MTPLGEILADEIRRGGPIPFSRFMETSLYHPEHGYYRRARDPFGRHGDFFTAEQLQPVFGILLANRIRSLWEELGQPDDFTVVEPGAGRREMARALSAWRYIPLEIACGELPRQFRGVVFSNEFFDALPVDVAVWRGGVARARLVGWNGSAFAWVEGERAGERADDYIRRFFPPPEDGMVFEIHFAALAWLERFARALRSGFVLTIDYGYTRRESVRFPSGTLMSYRRHTAREDVLAEPGERDITAHVPFSVLEEHGVTLGLEPLRLETLARTLMAAGEADRFASALEAGSPAEETERRLQLKTLLFGMGETFRTLLQRKAQK